MAKKLTNEFWSGLFIIAMTTLLLYGLFSVGKYKPAGETYTLYARFNAVGNLTENAVVKFQGVPVGAVKSISLQDDNTILVTMEMEGAYHPRTDNRALITASGFLGSDYIAIERPIPDRDGASPPPAPLIEPDAEGRIWIPTQDPFNVFAAMADLKAMLDDNKDSVGIIVERIRQTVDNQAFINNIHQTAFNARTATARFDSAGVQAQILLGNANEIVIENRPVIRETIENARGATASANQLVLRVDDLVERNEPRINNTLDNLDVTMENARIFSYAVAEKPWRLIWRDRARERCIAEGDTSVLVPSEF